MPQRSCLYGEVKHSVCLGREGGIHQILLEPPESDQNRQAGILRRDTGTALRERLTKHMERKHTQLRS